MELTISLCLPVDHYHLIVAKLAYLLSGEGPDSWECCGFSQDIGLLLLSVKLHKLQHRTDCSTTSTQKYKIANRELQKCQV